MVSHQLNEAYTHIRQQVAYARFDEHIANEHQRVEARELFMLLEHEGHANRVKLGEVQQMERALTTAFNSACEHSQSLQTRAY